MMTALQPAQELMRTYSCTFIQNLLLKPASMSNNTHTKLEQRCPSKAYVFGSAVLTLYDLVMTIL